MVYMGLGESPYDFVHFLQSCFVLRDSHLSNVRRITEHLLIQRVNILAERKVSRDPINISQFALKALFKHLQQNSGRR